MSELLQSLFQKFQIQKSNTEQPSTTETNNPISVPISRNTINGKTYESPEEFIHKLKEVGNPNK